MRVRSIILAIGAVSSVLLLWFVLLPLLSPYGTYAGLDGTAGVMDHDWGIGDIPYMLGDFLCHQDMDRSFVVNGNQFPFCIRDIGLLAGFSAGMLVASLPYPVFSDRRMPFAAVMMVAFTGIEWIAEFYAGDMPDLRFVSGVVAGTGAALLVSWLILKDVPTDIRE